MWSELDFFFTFLEVDAKTADGQILALNKNRVYTNKQRGTREAAEVRQRHDRGDK